MHVALNKTSFNAPIKEESTASSNIIVVICMMFRHTHGSHEYDQTLSVTRNIFDDFYIRFKERLNNDAGNANVCTMLPKKNRSVFLT